jgi:hypothetical protein
MAPATATNLVPSAEEATDTQALLGATVCAHVTPESAEVQIGPPIHSWRSKLYVFAATATSLVPSADEAAHDQMLLGAPVGFHVTPASAEL